ncbi:MAG: hypothetical protein ACE5LH_08760 [Fidelibacterota bacterium]
MEKHYHRDTSQKRNVYLGVMVSVIGTVFLLSTKLSGAPLPGEAAEKPALAVFQLSPVGISQLEADMVTRFLRSELIKTGLVRAIDSAPGDGSSVTGSFWDVLNKARVMGASLVTTGSLGKLGSTYVIDLRLSSTESGRVIRSFTRTYRGDVDGLMAEVEEIAWNLVAPPVTHGISAGKSPEETLSAGMLPRPQTESYSGVSLQNASLGTGRLPGIVSRGIFPLMVTGVAALVVSQLTEKDELQEIGKPPAFPRVP